MLSEQKVYKECNICLKSLLICNFSFFIRKNNNKIYTFKYCKECGKIKNRIYNDKNKERRKEVAKKWVENNRDSYDNYHKKYRFDNKEKIRIDQKSYYLNNKEELNAYKRIYNKKRKQEDPIYKMKINVSKLVSSYLVRHGFRKNKKSILDYLKYSIDDLKRHIESLFEPWMTWDNQGKYIKKDWDDNDPLTWTWQIDHIIPQSALPYTSLEDDNFQRCWALNNLRPLSAKENLLKGRSYDRSK